MARRRRSRRGSGDVAMLIGGVILIGLVLFGGAGLGYYYLTHESGPVLNKATLCPEDGPLAVTVVLVDASDELPEASKRQVAAIVQTAAGELAPYELLDIRVIDPARLKSRSVFARCNPGDGAGLSEWTANPKLARKRWEEGFQKPTEQAIETSMASAKASTSPIMAAIQDVALERFTAAQTRIASRRLIVVSDMIENNPDYTQYTGDLSFQRYRKSAAYRKFSTDLNGAQVWIRMVQRLSRKPTDDLPLAQFWREWVVDNKGRFQEATRLQGAG
jgi:hypothetical protein